MGGKLSILDFDPASVCATKDQTPEPARVADKRSLRSVRARLAQQARYLSETGGKLRTLLALIYSRLGVLGHSDEGVIKYRGLLSEAELGATIVEAIRVCSLNEITRDDREYLKPLSAWRQKAWEGMLEHGAALASCGIAEQWTESWSLATDLLDHRLRLSCAVLKGQLS